MYRLTLETAKLTCLEFEHFFQLLLFEGGSMGAATLQEYTQKIGCVLLKRRG